MNIINHIWTEGTVVARNIRSEFSTLTAKVAVTGIAAALFGLYVAIPVHFIPGNTVTYYFSIEPWWGFVLLAVLSIEIAMLVSPRILNVDLALTGNTVADVGAAAVSFVPAVFACPILAVAALSFVLPATTIYTLVGSQWQVVGLFTIVALGANYWKYSGCAKCQQWIDMEVNA